MPVRIAGSTLHCSIRECKRIQANKPRNARAFAAMAWHRRAPDTTRPDTLSPCNTEASDDHTKSDYGTLSAYS